MLAVGIGPPPDSITGIAPLVCRHFGVEPPAYATAAGVSAATQGEKPDR